ncbi:DNA phosphorothioation-dependent restriction protein DptG [Flavobacterium sp.]|uniref:DNA phosphorothioation-dependent restriction protein DptG n=1 Tax=Flavobacterium sp. TaxID=239 RepID=UPI002603FF1C|nr:DNA phosphorothioation-dependent restriction protein DptG [Flavobacterium sp.]
MMQIEIDNNEINGLQSRYLNKDQKFRGHYTGNKIKLLPFNTKLSGGTFDEDFKSFQGVIGELFRILNNKSQIELSDSAKNFKSELKRTILNNAEGKVQTENGEELKNILSSLYFDEDNGLVKFNIKTLSYMNFMSSNNVIREISKFLFEIFLNDDFGDSIFNEDTIGENLLNQLIIQCLPELPDAALKTNLSSYHNLFPGIKKQFLEDFQFLATHNALFLKHVEDFFKYYYFHYLSQAVLHFNDFGSVPVKIKPIYYTMDWETLSETRLKNHAIGWKKLSGLSDSIFAHVNTAELLNYIQIDGNSVGNYSNIAEEYAVLNPEEKQKFRERISEIISFYMDSIDLVSGSWEECKRMMDLDIATRNFTDPISKDIFSLWYTINYQFRNTKRENAEVKYAYGFYQFAKLNYTKYRGRLGNTTVLSQELLLLFTRICIGNEEKIRLRTLWDKMQDRGIAFDESTKLEIIRLFEKINLIEKKSDSGDAQYVKSTI